MAETIKPADAAQVLDAVKWAVSSEVPLELIGRGSKRALGRPFQAAYLLDLSGLSGILSYEPDELVLTALPGTPLAEIEASVAEKRQMLAFEPMDLAPLLGGPAGSGSIGGVFGANLSGPRRIKSGAARDHLLGFAGVSGRGEAYKAGGRVVKNVTGYDLAKLVTGSMGTLTALTEVTFKVLPLPEKQRTVLVFGLDDRRAIAAMTEALASPHEVSSAAHLPHLLAHGSAVAYVSEADRAVTALRIEGPGPSAIHRCQELRGMLQAYGPVEELHGRNSAAFWREIRDACAFWEDCSRPVWRLSVPPSTGWATVAEIQEEIEALAYYDWGGGLIWLEINDADRRSVAGDAGASVIRQAVAKAGGHATLIRAGAELRAAVPVFQPQPEPLARLTERVKASFDPKRILNPGRMYAGV